MMTPITTALNISKYSNEAGIIVSITIDSPPFDAGKGKHAPPTEIDIDHLISLIGNPGKQAIIMPTNQA